MLRRLGQRLFLLSALLITAILGAKGASADVIVYQIGSSGEIGQSPFSGIVAHCRNPDHDHSDDDDEHDRDGHKRHGEDRDHDDDKRHAEDRDDHDKWHGGDRRDEGGERWRGLADREDDDHDGGGNRDDDDGGFDKGDLEILSGDLSGLIGFSSEEPLLFLEGQELVVEEFSLAGSARFCPDCEEVALSVELDSRFDSILEVEDGSLEGEIRLLLSLDGGDERELTIKASGETVDPEWNTATPDFLSLMLELDVSDDFFRKELDDDEHGWDGDDDDDGHRRDCSSDCRIFLKAQGPVVPEPASGLLLGTGLLLLALARRR